MSCLTLSSTSADFVNRENGEQEKEIQNIIVCRSGRYSAQTTGTRGGNPAQILKKPDWKNNKDLHGKEQQFGSIVQP